MFFTLEKIKYFCQNSYISKSIFYIYLFFVTDTTLTLSMNCKKLVN